MVKRRRRQRHPKECTCDTCVARREEQVIERLVDQYRRVHGDEDAKRYEEALRKFKRRAP